MKGDKFVYNATGDGRIWADWKEPLSHPASFPNESHLYQHYYREWEAYNSRPSYAVSKELKWEVGQMVEEGKGFTRLLERCRFNSLYDVSGK